MIDQECEVRYHCERCKKQVDNDEIIKSQERGRKLLCKNCEKAREKEETELKERQNQRELKKSN
jgi:hypothetical protein